MNSKATGGSRFLFNWSKEKKQNKTAFLLSNSCDKSPTWLLTVYIPAPFRGPRSLDSIRFTLFRECDPVFCDFRGRRISLSLFDDERGANEKRGADKSGVNEDQRVSLCDSQARSLQLDLGYVPSRVGSRPPVPKVHISDVSSVEMKSIVRSKRERACDVEMNNTGTITENSPLQDQRGDCLLRPGGGVWPTVEGLFASVILWLLEKVGKVASLRLACI